MKRETRSSGWSAEVVLLVQDDHVVYKLMSGRPHIAGIDDLGSPSARCRISVIRRATACTDDIHRPSNRTHR